MQTKKQKPFSKLSKAQQRVAIAKDVIEQLTTEKITAVSGTYLSIPYAVLKPKDQLQDVFEARKCEACALGSIFVCAVKITNNLTAGEVGSSNDGEVRTNSINGHSMFPYLSKYFSREQICIIEGAFEGSNIGTYGSDQLSQDLSEAAGLGYTHIDSHEDRLKVIMRNIIRNKGTFVVPRNAIREFKNQFGYLPGKGDSDDYQD